MTTAHRITLVLLLTLALPVTIGVVFDPPQPQGLTEKEEAYLAEAFGEPLEIPEQDWYRGE